MRFALPLLCFACVTPASVGERIPDPVADLDGDGFDANADCNDLLASVNPGQAESCDGLDNDCDDTIDNGSICEMRLDVVQTMQLDVLFVVDNSASMHEEQVAVASGVSDLLEWVVGDFYDTHIAAISMDMENVDDRGRLRWNGSGTRNFTSALDDLESVEDFVQDVVVMGTTGHFDERGRDAVRMALVDRADTANEGFRRSDAHLAVLFISDEDDASFTPTADFLDALNIVAPDRSFHALVSPEYGCGESPGDDYLELVDASGGTTLSICEPNYGPFLAAVGQISALRALQREFQLPEAAQPGTVEVTVTYPSGLSLPVPPEQVALGGLGDVVVLTGTPPPAASRISIRYDRMP